MIIEKNPNNTPGSRIEKVKTQEELFELLHTYEGLLSKEIYEYIEGLINLDYSVIRDYITIEDKKLLGQLDLFRVVSIYNIYNRAIKIANELYPTATISGNDSHREGLDITEDRDEHYISLFNFNYSNGPLGIPRKSEELFKRMNVGNITIYESIDARYLKNEKKIEELTRELERLKSEVNPIEIKAFNKGLAQYNQWESKHTDDIRQIEQQIEALKNIRRLSIGDKKEIKKTRRFSEAILSDYGITKQDFEKSKSDYFEDAELLKCTKETPNIKIYRKVKKI